jgi:hypothetical protein
MLQPGSSGPGDERVQASPPGSDVGCGSVAVGETGGLDCQTESCSQAGSQTVELPEPQYDLVPTARR